jgi:SAM-dependent methyltransferase
VKFGLVTAAPNGEMMRELELFVGYNPMHWDRIKPLNYVEGTLTMQRRNSYMAKRFEPPGEPPASATVKLHGDKSVRCLNGDEIENNAIVEFMWGDSGWIPTRARHDKTDLLRKQGLSRTANDIKSALNIWKCIKDPITYDIITGATAVTSVIEDDDDTYYFRNISRDKMATKSMLDFHNYWIKNVQLIRKFKGDSIFDIACGKAGDLNKWIDAGYKKIVGVDYSRDNIENPVDGAYARTLKRREVANNHSFLYLSLDGGRRFDDDYFKALEDEDTRKIARVAWGYQKSPTGSRMSRFYRFITPTSFKTVSCQFAIHYFFKDNTTLDNFIYNVNTHLAPGGYFIGTCLDGKRIKAAFAEAKTDRLQGEKDGRLIWMIKRTGEEEVEIYMESIGKRMRENLVDFDVLVRKLAAHDIRLVQPIASFGDAFAELAANPPREAIVADSILKMTPEEKQYSFFNSYFVFQKNGSI